MVSEDTGARRLVRGERHRQLLEAATAAFAKNGFAATSLDDVAVEAGVTKAIIYRHFDSKAELYGQALDNVRASIRRNVGNDDHLGRQSVMVVIRSAAADPHGFRLLFEHSRHEPEFRSYSDELAQASITVAEQFLHQDFPDRDTRRWVADMLVWHQIELTLSWLRANQPVSPDRLAAAILAASQALTASLRATSS